MKLISFTADVRDLDSWLHANGHPREATLRRGVVADVTPAERRAFEQRARALKTSGLLPSALGAIIERIGQ